MSPPELGVLGGSFDPPHLAHVMLALFGLSSAGLERVVVAPTFIHAFGKRLGDFDHRLRMCELAFQPLPAVEVSAIERELGGVSRTLRLIEALSQRYPRHRLRLLVGSDILAERDRWQDFDAICARAPLLVAQRAGYGSEQPTLQLPEISSSDVRAALARDEDVTGWLPVAVRTYIATHGLYTGAA
jgi:nicotinate-nucleotide adenylyltransferase